MTGLTGFFGYLGAMRTILCVAVACAAPAVLSAAPPSPGTIEVEQRTLRTADGRAVRYEIGTLFVPENRLAPRSRVIGMGFARIRTEHPGGVPPAFLLQGGPGGPGASYLDMFAEPRSPGLERRLAFMLAYAAFTDVVLIDQRGSSTRGEVLTVSGGAPEPLDRPATPAALAESLMARARAAVASHPDKDLAGYTLAQSAGDIDDLRRLLGYDQITLVGQSFGSQESLAVLRLHPTIVARALLSSVEPLDNGYDMPSHVYATLQRIASDADRDPGLAPFLPEGGVMAAVRSLHQRFAAGPVSVDVADGTGSARVVLGLGDLQDALTSQAAEDWPAFVLSLYHSHYDAWAREVLAARRAPAETSLAGWLVDSSTGVSAARLHQLRTDPAIDQLGTWSFEPYHAAASALPVQDAGDAFRLPVTNSVPLLVVHGDWDLSTPIENLLSVLPYFTNSRAVVVHRGGHAQPTYNLRHDDAARAAMIAFVRTGRFENVPSAVTLPVPAFTRPPFPPPAR